MGRSRDKEVIIPGGNDIIKAGDRLTLFTVPENIPRIGAFLSPGGLSRDEHPLDRQLNGESPNFSRAIYDFAAAVGSYDQGLTDWLYHFYYNHHLVDC